MTSDDAAGPGDGVTGEKTGPLPFDTSKAHQARMYDYLLGGKDNYEADRVAIKAVLDVYPDMAFTARANRAFLGRVIRYLAEDAGIRQFLDIGTGIPTAGNTHQVAQAIAPESRVVYVDYDPVVLAHARALLTSSEAGATEYIDADLRDTDAILTQARQLLDFTKPVAVTLVALLHAIPDSDDPHAIVARLMDAVPAGSYLALSHMGSDPLTADTQQGIKNVIRSSGQQQYFYRTREQVARFFGGTDLVEPGLVRVEEWHPAPGPPRTTSTSSLWSAVGRKR
jgi:S-adenosyl methyltransferase